MKAVFLDFDGTLVDLGVDWPRLRARLREYFQGQGLDLPAGPLLGQLAQALETLRRKGVQERRLRRTRRAALALIDQEEVAALPASKPVEGARELLQWLRSHQLKIAIVTRNGGKVVRGAFQRFGFPPPHLIITRDTAEAVKPDPKVIEAALERLRVDKSQCLLVGDSALDLELGRRANIATVLLDRGSHLSHGRVISHLRDLPPVLDSIDAGAGDLP